MTKIQIKSEKITPSGVIFHLIVLFYRLLSHTTDRTPEMQRTSFGH